MAGENEKEDISKKCAFSGKNLKRVKRYYRNGKYYLNKTSFKAQQEKEKEAAAQAAAKEGASEAAS